MYLLLVVVVWLVFGYFFIDRKNWLIYYPTVLFFIVSNLFYNFLYYNHTLWSFRAVTTDLLNHTFIDVGFSFIIMPILIIIYLQRFPKKETRHKVIYILIWGAFFSIIEYLFYKKGMFIYDNGWNHLYMTFFNFALLIILKIHVKKPLLAIILSLPITIILILLFPVPHEVIK